MSLQALADAIDGLDVGSDAASVTQLLWLRDRLEAKVVDVVIGFDAECGWGFEGGGSLPAWLRTEAGCSDRDANRLVDTARPLTQLLEVHGRGAAVRSPAARSTSSCTPRPRNGCRRPSWCSAHHVHFWDNGGPTDIDNLVLLRAEHHRRLHQPRWHNKLLPDGTYEITWRNGTTRSSRPPSSSDPSTGERQPGQPQLTRAHARARGRAAARNSLQSRAFSACGHHGGRVP